MGALASGEICFVVGWSGGAPRDGILRTGSKSGRRDVLRQSGHCLAAPKNVTEWLIDYLYRPEVAAKNSDFLSYANGNLASQKLINPKILNDKKHRSGTR